MIDALRRRKTVVTPAPASDGGDGLVRVSVASLLALHHGAGALSLQPRRVRAPGSGGYASPFKGRGMEFDEVRPYAQGDDVRSIDWRVTARSGKPHTKLFREERERAVLLWLDLRPAMFFATRGSFKAVRAAQAAALLGWNTLRHGDRLGALIFDAHNHAELRPSAASRRSCTSCSASPRTQRGAIRNPATTAWRDRGTLPGLAAPAPGGAAGQLHHPAQ